MYQKTVAGLITLSVLASLSIIGIILWQDYQRYGDLKAGRAFGSAGGRFAEIPELIVGPFQSDAPTPPATLTTPAPTSDTSDTLVVAGLTPNGRAVEPPPAAARPTVSPPSPVAPEELRLLQRLLLGLINADRAHFGLVPLTLGDNPAAQGHAEDMMRRNYRSHWGANGLAPYMRYTLAGGFNRELQNISGPDVLTGGTGGRSESPSELMVRTQEAFMVSPEQRANILDPWHRKVNLGIACNALTCWVVQQFEADHIRFSALPAIAGGRLNFAGELAEGMGLDGVAVWYHPPPRPLTLGQLDATYSYGAGQYPAVFLRPPLEDDRYYADNVSNYAWKTGIDPYALDPGLGRINAPPLRVDVVHTRAVPWTTAAVWESAGSSFRVTADLAPILEDAGPGVYTVQIWAKAGEERVAVTNYSIFVE